MDEQHSRPGGEHEPPQVVLGLDCGTDGRGVVWAQPLAGGAWSDVGYLTSDGLAYTEEQPQTEAALWDAAARGGKTSTTGRASYDKTPEATRRRAAVWTDRSWLDVDQVVDELLADEERRIRSWRTREPLHHVIDGEWAESRDPVAGLPPHVVEARDRLAEWARRRVDWPPIVAEWRPPIAGTAAGYRPADDLDRWEYDGGG